MTPIPAVPRWFELDAVVSPQTQRELGELVERYRVAVPAVVDLAGATFDLGSRFEAEVRAVDEPWTGDALWTLAADLSGYSAAHDLAMWLGEVLQVGAEARASSHVAGEGRRLGVDGLTALRRLSA